MKKPPNAETATCHEQGLARVRKYRQKQRENPQDVRMQTKLPKGAAEKVRRWASESASRGAIARRLGMDAKTFRALMERNPELQAAYDDGVETEHQMLIGALKAQLLKGPVPAIFLLKTRHGYREGDQSEQANRVSITFNLPGALPLDKFKQGCVIEHDAQGGDDGSDDPNA